MAWMKGPSKIFEKVAGQQVAQLRCYSMKMLLLVVV
jgi:hypothetical protein